VRTFIVSECGSKKREREKGREKSFNSLPIFMAVAVAPYSSSNNGRNNAAGGGISPTMRRQTTTPPGFASKEQQRATLAALRVTKSVSSGEGVNNSSNNSSTPPSYSTATSSSSPLVFPIANFAFYISPEIARIYNQRTARELVEGIQLGRGTIVKDPATSPVVEKGKLPVVHVLARFAGVSPLILSQY